jgi:hypothetical protein
MKRPEDHESPEPGGSAGADRSPGRPDDGDVIEMGGRPGLWPWRGRRGTTADVALAALAVGLLLGFAGGHLAAVSAEGKPPRAAPSALGAASLGGSTAIAATGSRCAVQRGSTLQLGIEIVNQSASAVALRQVRSVLPLGGMHAIASGWDTCGSLPEPGQDHTSLDPGATGWVTMTFDVLVPCPGALPVQFNVSYRQSGRQATAALDSFPDLGQVQYTGCGPQH